MSDSDEEQSSSDNVFVTLVAQVTLVQRPQVPRPWGQQTYVPRIYKTLGKLLRNVTPEKLDSTIADFIHFAKRAHTRMGAQFYMEFINVCTNIILHWVCTHSGNAHIVRRLMELMSVYVQNQTDQLALAWRSFTPIYCPMGGLTPLMLVAQNFQFDALKILLQYGMLERERRPSYIIISILFNPLPLEELNNLSHNTRITELTDCLALCLRVLTHVSIADIEMHVMHGLQPLIKEWRDHIPRNRCQDPCELSHLCRAVIRRRLLVLSLLPGGIGALPLPLRLQGYLNLEG